LLATKRWWLDWVRHYDKHVLKILTERKENLQEAIGTLIAKKSAIPELAFVGAKLREIGEGGISRGGRGGDMEIDFGVSSESEDDRGP